MILDSLVQSPVASRRTCLISGRQQGSLYPVERPAGEDYRFSVLADNRPPAPSLNSGRS
jgi:hypothetical protein